MELRGCRINKRFAADQLYCTAEVFLLLGHTHPPRLAHSENKDGLSELENTVA